MTGKQINSKDATIILKSSIRKGKVPKAEDLQIGEVALSLYKGEESIWAKNSAGEIVKLNSASINNLWNDGEGSAFLFYTDYIKFQEDLQSGIIHDTSIVFINSPEYQGFWVKGIKFTTMSSDVSEKIEEVITVTETVEEIESVTAPLKNLNLPLPKPEITGAWTITNRLTGEVRRTTEDPEVETIEDAVFSGTYKWTLSEGTKSPTAVAPGSSWDVLSESGISSPVYQGPGPIRVGLTAPKTGLIIDSETGSVIPAVGDDVVWAERDITRVGRIWEGTLEGKDFDDPAETLTPEDIQTLSTSLNPTREYTVTVNQGDTEYYVYAYPMEWGRLQGIECNGSSVLGAFTVFSGLVVRGIEVIAYVTNNPGAFTESIIKFK